MDGERLGRLQEAVASAFSRREVCSQAMAIIMDNDVGRQRFFDHPKHTQIVDSVLSPSDSVDWSGLMNTYRASQTRSGGPTKSVLPLSSHKGFFGLRRQAAVQEQVDSEDSAEIRPWTASEALMVASLAGDERGQKAIFSSEIAVPTIIAVMQETLAPASALSRGAGGEELMSTEAREAALNRHNDRARQLALLKAVAHLAKSALPQAKQVLECDDLVQALMRLRASDPVTAQLATGALQEMARASPAVLYALRNSVGPDSEARAGGDGNISVDEGWTGPGLWGPGAEEEHRKQSSSMNLSPVLSKALAPDEISINYLNVALNAAYAGLHGMMWVCLRGASALAPTIVPPFFIFASEEVTVLPPLFSLASIGRSLGVNVHACVRVEPPWSVGTGCPPGG